MAIQNLQRISPKYYAQLLPTLLNQTKSEHTTTRGAEKYYIVYLVNEIEDQEQAELIVSFEMRTDDTNILSDRLSHERYSFFWKYGEIGQLLPCPVISYRFHSETHLNDVLSRALSQQLCLALKQPQSVFGEQSYVSPLLSMLVRHLVHLDISYWEEEGSGYVKITPRQLNAIKNYVNTYLDEPILVKDLSELTGLSEGYFYEVFKQTTGLTPVQYITACRMEKAKVLLLNSSESIIQISLTVGINNPSYFCRLFRREVGLSPTQFRQRYAAQEIEERKIIKSSSTTCKKIC